MKKLLLLHGALGTQEQFTGLKALLSHDFDLHSLDFYGHGKADFSAEFGMEAFAWQTGKYLEEHQLKGCDVFGYSMGGYVALYLERQQPGSFTSIMTLGTKFNWNPESSAKEAAMLDPGKIKEKVPAYASRLQEYHGDKWEELCRQTAGMMTQLGRHPLLDSTALADIRLNVNVCLGDRDKMVSPEETIEAFRSLENGSLCIMPNTPHPLEQVDLQRLAAQVRTFTEAN